MVLLALSLALMTMLGSIQTAWQISLLFGAGVGAVLVLRWLWERVNLLAEAASIVVSLLLAPVLLLTVADDWLRLLLMAAASLLVVVLAALFGPATEPDRLATFYRSIRPPGWWSASAAAAGADAKAPLAELRRRMISVLACAFSTYAWLVGASDALLGVGPAWRTLPSTIWATPSVAPASLTSPTNARDLCAVLGAITNRSRNRDRPTITFSVMPSAK